MSKREARLSALEAGTGGELSERAKAWLGLRGPLTAEEEAAERVGVVDRSKLSAQLREWLQR